MSAERIIKGATARIVQFRPSEGKKSASIPNARLPGSEDQEHGPAQDPHSIEREAFQKGFESGEKAGLAVAERKTEAVLRRFARALEKLTDLREEIIRRSQDDLVRLSVEIARKLVHREIGLDETIISALARVALEKLNVDGKVTISLNPEDYEYLQSNLEDLGQEQHVDLHLRAVDQLNRGDCTIESEYGQIDARISAQFEEIERGLLEDF